MMRQRFFLAILVVGGILAAQSLPAQSLNIDLGNYFGTPSNTYGAAASQPGTWNTLGNGTTPGLLGLGGTATSVSATVTADNDQGWLDTCTGDPHALMDDNIYSSGGDTWTVALTGLANGPYTLYLYDPTNGAVVTGNMTVNGTPVTGITGHGCTLTAGSTDTTTQVTVTDGTLTIIGSSTGTPDGNAGLAGLQLQSLAQSIPVASPWGLVLLALAVAVVAVIQLRRYIGA